MFVTPLLGLVSCWYTGAEWRDAVAEGGDDADAEPFGDDDADADTDTDADADADADTAVEPYTCVEGESAPGTDAAADYTATASVRMVGIPSGSFCMGSEAEDADDYEQPVHPVTLTRPFWIGKSEVTQAQYEAVTGETPSDFAGCDDCPVEQVSWYNAVVFANAVSDAEGLERCYVTLSTPEPVSDPYSCEGYRLPTEAEWEYAGRGGEAYAYAGSDDLDAVGWTSENSDEPHLACELDTNGFGLCDMSGNVQEWTGDGWDGDYYGVSPVDDPPGPSDDSFRVTRGGAWFGPPANARVAYRILDDPGRGWEAVGFRLARTSL